MVCLQQSFLHCTPHTFLPHNFFQVNNNGSSLKRVSFLVKSQHVSSEDRISKRQLLTLGVSIPGILLFAETPISFEGTGENVLAKHVAFFDRNNDGVVYPWETFQGFRAIGCGLMLSTVAGFIINVGLSHKTRPGKFPSLLFPIEIKNIAKAKHGSDSGVYDHQGRFVQAKFDAIFNKHAHSNANALTGKELEEMLKANREPKDYPGWFGAYIEWKILYNLCKDKNGFLERDVIRGVYDGSLFEKMELAKKESKKPKHG